MPFGYPKRVFNNFPLRDLSDLMVIDGAGKRNGHILVCRFPWRSEYIKYLPLSPPYKKKRRELFPSYMNPLDSSQSLLLPSGYTLNCDTFTIVISNEGTIPFPKTSCSNKTRNGSVRARMAETQDLSHFPFSQNPKQGLVTSNFRRDWAEDTHYQYQLFSHEHI